jgi:Replication-relaxation
MSQLLSTKARERRAAEKATLVLRFLRGEIFSDAQNLGLLLGIATLAGTIKALRQLEKHALLREHRPDGHRTLWGITQHGQALAFDPVTEAPKETYFEPGRVALPFLQHTLGLQRLRILAERAGWSKWTAGDRAGKWARAEKRPDALAITPDGLRVAVEYERTFKTIRRYEDILAGYLMAVKRKDIDLVIWVCPTKDSAVRLRRIVESIQAVPVAGRRVAIDPARHHRALRFCSADAWPIVSVSDRISHKET